MKTITIEIPDGKKAKWVNGVLTLVDDKPQELNEQIKSFEDAVRFLGVNSLDNNKDLIFAQDYPVSFVATNKDMCKINAYTKLLIIATAWNKIDGFEADFGDKNQYKHFPWFEYSEDAAGFVFANTHNAASSAFAYYGAGLCFKTRERAEQFGKQFIDLWNDLLK